MVEDNRAYCEAVKKQNLDHRFLSLKAFAYPLPDLLPNTLVFDIKRHMASSPSVLEDSREESAQVRASSCPQEELFSWQTSQHIDTPAVWNRTLLRRDGEGGLLLDRTGQSPTQFCRNCLAGISLVRFISPDQAMLLRSDANAVIEAVVVGKDGVEQFRMDPKQMSLDTFVVFNASGTRFALMWSRQSALGHMRYYLDDFFSDGSGITYDRKTIQVFSSTTGHKLFEKKWKGREESYSDLYYDERVALSEDGDLLAYLTGKDRLVIERIPRDRK